MSVYGLTCTPSRFQFQWRSHRFGTFQRSPQAFTLSHQTETSNCCLPCSSKLYKRLGISRMASEDEIQGARKFLIQQYADHKPSVDSIESAHDKIILQKFHERKNPKIDIKQKSSPK